ncbi:MAG: hypothetical protein J7518_07435 [Nocardioidaceae bacterium]|nr:hypothetical protein [Nocardioidaceae bacterium]
MQNQATGQAEDVEQLLKLHRDWYFSNYNINIPLMRTLYPPKPDQYLMFNLNGHPYFGVDELDDLWSFYARTDRWGKCEDYVMRVDVVGDMGYVVSEGIYPSWVIKDEDGNLLDEEIDVTFRYRSTEIYKRDDGEGGKEWKMWHFHCSERPEDDAIPDAKTSGSSAERGLGNTPYSQGTYVEL